MLFVKKLNKIITSQKGKVFVCLFVWQAQVYLYPEVRYKLLFMSSWFGSKVGFFFIKVTDYKWMQASNEQVLQSQWFYC